MKKARLRALTHIFFTKFISNFYKVEMKKARLRALTQLNLNISPSFQRRNEESTTEGIDTY